MLVSFTIYKYSKYYRYYVLYDYEELGLPKVSGVNEHYKYVHAPLYPSFITGVLKFLEKNSNFIFCFYKLYNVQNKKVTSQSSASSS
jgi:hypothetical protein